MKTITAILLALACIFCLAACAPKNDGGDLWADAKYTKDTELGEGATKVVVEVKAGDKSVTFTVNTDETTVGAALMEHGLIEGDEGDYGLYVKKVNGILADYDVDQTYWAFYINGEYAMTGVDVTDIAEGDTYILERTK